MTFDEAFLFYLGSNQNNCLNNLRHIKNKTQLIHHSSYYDIDKFHLLANSNTDKFNILIGNTQSINAKFDELEIFVELLNTINFKFSIICLQETWKSENKN